MPIVWVLSVGVWLGWLTVITKDVITCSVLQDPSPVMLRIQLAPSPTVFLCSGSPMLRRKVRLTVHGVCTGWVQLCIGVFIGAH